MSLKIRKLLFAALTFVFTLFVFLNAYEMVFSRDIPIADSMRRIAAQQTINNAVREFGIRNLTDEINASASFDNMERLEIPALDVQLNIEESRKINGDWYARPGAVHSFGLNKNQQGQTIDYLLYAVQSWRTITNPDRIEKGMEVDVQYGGNPTATFVVKDKKRQSIGESLLVGKLESRQMLLIIENTTNDTYYGYSLELKNE